ncbi:unnamed protein product [Bursaphelenchus okinawaensis]|uniref:Rad50/SbcC-type AAA domain-containing protein n=1 Tax=Bursaphelenchus okinawaensis TaxID=465554 RepID=A0A811L9J3_9BILA|nr:unnamed protein product [Bursaphelenchus okinawaensis]CAG9120291.1 unnamed protein product [Bursaphelenchus okinawaensis]
MTTLKSLRIQNVRSVGDEPQVIEFLKPLTIIQGPNGTGKTTTIECLNYITNGALPSGKMQSFIHNNKLSKKKKIDALVQLEFINFHGVFCTATKRMTASLSPKTDKITTKSDEFTLAVRGANGKLQAMSAKVADFNREMQNHLGVSSAILNHVIFCHQEESNWPLSEPKELKVRFDAIFEVTKYVKAVEGLKKSAKEWENDLKVVLAEIPLLKSANDSRVQQCMLREDTKTTVAQLQKEVNDELKEVKQLEDELKAVRKESFEVVTLEGASALICKEIEALKDSVLGLNVEPFKGTREELREKINQSLESCEMMDIASRRESTKREEVSLNEQLKEKTDGVNQLQSYLNKAEANEMIVENYKKECNELIAQGQHVFGINGDGAVFISSLEKMTKELEAELKNFDSLQSFDRRRIAEDLNEAKKASHENELMNNINSREEKKLNLNVQKLEKKLKDVTEKSEALTSDVRHLKVRLSKLSQRNRIDVAVVSNQLQGLENEAKVITELSSNNVNIDDLVQGVEGLSIDHEHAFQKLSVRFLANRLKKNVREAAENGDELKNVEQEVLDLKTKLNELEGAKIIFNKWTGFIDENQNCPLCDKKCQGNEGHSIKEKLNIANVEEEILSIKERLAEVQKTEMNLIFQQRVKYVKDEISSTQESIRKENDISRMEADLTRQIENLERTVEQLKVDQSKLELELEEEKKKLQDVKTELDQIRSKRESVKSTLEQKHKALEQLETNSRSERAKITTQLNDRKNLLDNLTKVFRKLAELEASTLDKAELEQKKLSLNEEIERIRRALNDCTLTLANCDNQESQHRVLEDQMRLFRTRDRIRALMIEKEELGLEKRTSANELNEKEKVLNKKALAKRSRIDQKEGRLRELQNKLKEIEVSLRSESMKNAKSKLYQKVTEKMVYQAGIEDLKKYSKVLDDSIIAFHHQKMEQINQILGDLWPRVYQGSDIETIRIKSQAIGSGEKKKSYDYSVVMVVDQQELEMRDRCSAGQKVLASILIRIALADVFGGDCPILALDEPTTNLDASKVENIGTMLKDLLDVYNTPDNSTVRNDLQLLVITHDRRLVDHLYLACRPEFLYVLSKDELGMSHITKKTALNDGTFAY